MIKEERLRRIILAGMVIGALLVAILAIYVAAFNETGKTRELLKAQQRIKELEDENAKLKTQLKNGTAVTERHQP